MQIRKTALSLSLLTLVCSPLVGCWFFGGSSPTQATTVAASGQSGKVAQGAVSNATVWADSLTSGTRFVIDSAEQSSQTTTSSTGTYTLPVQPSYKYVVVSQGGTDTVTGKTASTLIAPAGAATVSPLTTLVSLDTSGNLAATINALLPAGTTYASDLTAAGGLSPAAMVLITAITSAVTTIDAAIQDAAGSTTLSAQQISDINMTMYSQIATQLSTASVATLSNTATLATNLQTALTTAVTTISSNNTNITGLNATTIGSTVANSSVASAAVAVGNATGNASLSAVTASNVQTTGVTSSTTTTVTESTVLSPTAVASINNSNTTVATSSSAGVTVTSTPSSYNPPTIPIINNPSIIGYRLAVNASNNEWTISTLTITFSDDMVSSTSGGTNYAHSVLNPANYVFSPSGCTPSSYASDVVSFTCSSPVPSGSNLVVQILGSSSTGGVWSNTTSLGLPLTNTKTFVLPTVTGSTGGSSLVLF